MVPVGCFGEKVLVNLREKIVFEGLWAKKCEHHVAKVFVHVAMQRPHVLLPKHLGEALWVPTPE